MSFISSYNINVIIKKSIFVLVSIYDKNSLQNFKLNLNSQDTFKGRILVSYMPHTLLQSLFMAKKGFQTNKNLLDIR